MKAKPQVKGVKANAENKKSEKVRKEANSTIKKAKAVLKTTNDTPKSPMTKAKVDVQADKTEKQNAKIDSPQVKKDQARKKRWKANKHKRNLLHTLVKLTAENNLQRMKEQLPAIENEIQNLYSKTLSKSATRRLRMLEGYEKKIKSGNMGASAVSSKKVKAKRLTKASK